MTYRLVRVPAEQIADTADITTATIDSPILNDLAKEDWRIVSIAVDSETQDVIAAMEHEPAPEPREAVNDIFHTLD